MTGTYSDLTPSLSASSARMEAASPVFIVGHTRSGTSLLYRTLQQHSTFRPQRIDLHETQLLFRLPLAFRFDRHPPRQLLAFMLGHRGHYDAFLRETRAMRLATTLAMPLNVPAQGDVPLAAWRAQRLHLVVRSYFSHAWSARGCIRLVEKSPRNIRHTDKLRLVSPRARMLFLCRHPVDVYSSYRKRARTDPRAASWADISVRRFNRLYRAAVRRAIQEARDPRSGLLLIKYEDLTADPHGQFKGICEFLDEPFEPSALDDRSSDRALARFNRQLQPEITTSTKRWADFVTASEAAAIETRLGAVMADLGYPRYT